MTSQEIRDKYLQFFESKGHKTVPSASLVPEGDSTTLFTGSGMQPMVPYLLGQDHPLGTRIADSQKCFRAEDIEEVGDNRHTTFFEMLGNWSLGDYWKEDQLAWLFEFLFKEIGLDPNKIYTTVFIGNKKYNFPRDAETGEIYKRLFSGFGIEAKEVDFGSEENAAKIGMGDGRIFYYDKKNWWSRAGQPETMPANEPGGPNSEIFYEFSEIEHNTKYGKFCHPNCDCGRYLEIGNSVFMQYVKQQDGTFIDLPKRNVDFGGGLERIIAASNNNPDVFQIDLLKPLIEQIKALGGKDNIKAQRIVADHVRAATFIIANGVTPSNTGRGYMLRRLIRRAAVYGKTYLGLPPHFQFKISEEVLRIYTDAYPELKTQRDSILEEIVKEENKFDQTLKDGLKAVDHYIERAKKHSPQSVGFIRRCVEGLKALFYDPTSAIKDFWSLIWSIFSSKQHVGELAIDGKDLFNFYQSYGLPFEVILEILDDHGLKYEKSYLSMTFQNEFKKHQDLSRTSSAGQFKGGLASHSDKIVRLHTATHLLNAALRKVLGAEVWQKGSNITEERTRFDFTHGTKMTDEQKKQVEDLVNNWIRRDLQVKKEIMKQSEAKDLGAIGVFGEKYADEVSVYTVFDPVTNEVVSREFCGGPHVEHTGTIGKIKIQKEEAVSAGVRRIKAVIE